MTPVKHLYVLPQRQTFGKGRMVRIMVMLTHLRGRAVADALGHATGLSHE